MAPITIVKTYFVKWIERYKKYNYSPVRKKEVEEIMFDFLYNEKKPQR